MIAIEANGENTGAGEVAENLVDGSSQTKWLVFEETGWVEMELSEPVAVVHYALISANDADERDPKDWTLSGSNDGETWTALDAQTDQDFDARFQTKEYRFENTPPTRTTGSTSPRTTAPTSSSWPRSSSRMATPLRRRPPT